MAKNLKAILRNLSPSLRDGDFVFATFPSMLYGERADLKPVAAVREQEGLTLIIPRREADENGVNYDGVYKMITLEVHSSLEAVGMTAAFATRLSEQGINANVVAGFHHDHVFVGASRADDALKAMEGLQAEAAAE